MVAGVALDYYILLESHAKPGEVAPDVLFRLGIVDGPFAMVWGLIAACLYAGYRIDRRYHADIRRQLEARRAQVA